MEIVPLASASVAHGGVLRLSALAASDLLSAPQNEVVPHGDVHHGNILHFDERGWLAIAPKGLFGECGFDYANLFCNPSHRQLWPQHSRLTVRRHAKLVFAGDHPGQCRFGQ